jgi:hypothetical protein
MRERRAPPPKGKKLRRAVFPIRAGSTTYPTFTYLEAGLSDRDKAAPRIGKPKAMVSGPAEIVADPSKTTAPVHRSLKARSA